MASQINPTIPRQLTAEERLRLIEELWDSLDPDQTPLYDWQREELDRRLDALDEGATTGAPWPEVRDRILRRS